MTLIELDPLAKSLRQRRDALATEVALLNHAIENFTRARIPVLKRLVSSAAEHHQTLYNAIDTNRNIFDSPRTIILHGIKLGLRKGAGRITWDDDAKVCALIEKHFSADEAALLVKTEKAPVKKALAGLDVSDLKKIGCTIEGTTDKIVITPTDTAVDKTVAALLKSATADLEEKEAA